MMFVSILALSMTQQAIDLPPPPPAPTPKIETSERPASTGPETAADAAPARRAMSEAELLERRCPTRGIVESVEAIDDTGTPRKSRVTLCAKDNSDETYRSLLQNARQSISTATRLTVESRASLLERIDEELALLGGETAVAEPEPGTPVGR
ncbi:hypothetical protein WJS89_03935 [Sphingomicrobium sp. XHP0235]|uniref:hypothetical protein n=1 Tax=Sphingomicrobium aquimarinum TaxID=3133971 RepID=UPI0031FE4F6D